MSNRTSSHQHCLVRNFRPKSKLRFRFNKAKAQLRRIERHTKLNDHYQKSLAAIVA